MRIPSGLFKAYDIRGVVPTSLDEELAQALGRAWGALARAHGEARVAAGRDGRLSGAALHAALVHRAHARVVQHATPARALQSTAATASAPAGWRRRPASWW